MIDTREELIDALTEAAELEHTLLIQYLFAAFTLKRRLDEGLTPLNQSKIISWESTILEVARDEMGHLGLVCNLLSAIGGAPRFGRPNFPKSAEKYYPLIGDFTLSKFSHETLYRFVCFELPIDEAPPEIDELKSFSTMAKMFAAPDPLIYNRVGELYSQISEAFTKIEESKLFIGPKHAQDTDDWSVRLKINLVHDVKSAQKAIEAIIIDGEGTTSNRENSHYKKFYKIWKEIKTLDFEPSRNVVDNPFTRKHRDSDPSGTINIIKNESTKDVSELFNSLYNIMLLMLMQYYSYSGETESQRIFLRNTLGQMMSGLIRPIAEILTEMPISENPDEGLAGPSFEIYSDLRISPFIENRWTILNERFTEAKKSAELLINIHPRIEIVTQKIGWIIQNLEKETINRL